MRDEPSLWLQILRVRLARLPLAMQVALVALPLLLVALLWRLTRKRFTARSLRAVVPVVAAVVWLQVVFWTQPWFRELQAIHAVVMTATLGALAWLRPSHLRWLLGPVLSKQYVLGTCLVIGVLGYALWFTVLPECHFGLGTDEGLYIHGAQRILAGQVPNRDFFSFIPPGSYATLALVAWIRGQVLAFDARMVAAICGLAAVLAYAYVLQPHGGESRFALGVLSLALGIWSETGPGSYFSFSHHCVSLFWGAMALVAFAPSLCSDRPIRRWEIVLSGLAASLALMTTTNLGVYVAVALAAWLVLDHWMMGQASGAIRALIAFGLSVLSLPALYGLFHLLIGNGPRLYEELVKFVVVNYAGVNAGRLDYLFFFRMRLAAAHQQFLDKAALQPLMISALGTGMVFLGHLPALIIAGFSYLAWRRGRGERAPCRALLLLALYYAASMATSVTNPFFANVRTHALPGYIILINWCLNRSRAVLDRMGAGLGMVAALLLLAWVLLLPNWRAAPRLVLATSLGELSYYSADRFSDEQEVFDFLESKGDGLSLVAYHYLAPRWYAYFPHAQRLRFSVLVPFYSPTEHYLQALEAMQRERIQYAVEDQSLQMATWDPRVRFGSLMETNGGMFYRYVREHGCVVLSNSTFTVWELASPSHAGESAAAPSPGFVGAQGGTPPPQRQSAPCARKG